MPTFQQRSSRDWLPAGRNLACRNLWRPRRHRGHRRQDQSWTILRPLLSRSRRRVCNSLSAGYCPAHPSLLGCTGPGRAMLLLLVADIAIAAYCRWHHADLDQIEPASLFRLSARSTSTAAARCCPAGKSRLSGHPRDGGAHLSVSLLLRVTGTATAVSILGIPIPKDPALACVPTRVALAAPRRSSRGQLSRFLRDPPRLLCLQPYRWHVETAPARTVSSRSSMAATPCAPSIATADNLLEHFSK